MSSEALEYGGYTFTPTKIRGNWLGVKHGLRVEFWVDCKCCLEGEPTPIFRQLGGLFLTCDEAVALADATRWLQDKAGGPDYWH